MYQVNVKICSQQGTHFLEFADEASWDFTCANQASKGHMTLTYYKTWVQWGVW